MPFDPRSSGTFEDLIAMQYPKTQANETDKFTYLRELGYSDEKIASYAKAWAPEIISYLSENQSWVSDNMKHLKDDFDHDLLLKLPIFYPDAFVMHPFSFKVKYDLIKSAFPEDYKEIIEKQFYAYEGHDSVYVNSSVEISDLMYVPFLEILTRDVKDVLRYIDTLHNSAGRTYKFIIMLNKELDLGVSAEDFQEESLLDLEESKWEVLHNSEFLVKEGLNKDIIYEVLYFCPYLMCLSTAEIQAILTERFGENYIAVMNDIYEDEDENFGDILIELY